MSNSGPNVEPQPGFAKLLDIYPGVSKDGNGSATMTIRQHHLQDSGVVQGGLIVTLADYAFFRAAKTKLRPGQRTVTVELKINFIASANRGELTANATVVSAGGRIIVVEGEVVDDQQTLIARGLSTYMVIQPRGRSTESSRAG